MSLKEDFPALEPPANSVSETLTISMDTEPHPPSPEDLAKCTRMLDTHEYLMVKETKLIQTNNYLMMVRTGILRKNQTTYDSMKKEADDHTVEIQRIKGELALFGICPIVDCQHHTKLNSPRMVKKIEDCTKQLQTKFANTHLTATVSGGNSSVTLKKNNRQDGFVTPAKVAKKQKVLQNYSFGAATPVSTTNQFQALTGSDALPTPDPTAVPVAHPPQDPPIHIKFANNYNLILQEINRKFPKTKSKLSGEYLRIFASTTDDHRDITLFLKEKGVQFFAFHSIDLRPQKVVIKGLPISTDICDIQKDLTERGFLVNKVAQLTKTKTKFKLPIFMVELQKSPDSPDIFKLESCCYLTVKIDTFNRRPGPTQCYNCNLFNHSSQNCFIKTRCLKCGEPHKKGDCPIKEKIENPTCINCGEKGHLANSHRCVKFPKIQRKKGESSQNRLSKIPSNQAPPRCKTT
ncbi:nucleic-acid-binding protein from transposon X-element [Trichonephila clavipes]|nr:nucleic-acid-binding protein from transposon X-element [Trichonephila clavipes]